MVWGATQAALPTMKDPKLLVKQLCTAKKIYLFKPDPSSDFHIRFTPPRPIRNRLGIKERVFRSTGHKHIAPARERAREIVESFWSNDGRLDAETRLRLDFTTIGKLLDVYMKNARERQRTVRNNANALRLIVRSVMGGDPNDKSSVVLTGDLIRKFERMRGSKTSTSSYARQARSVVAVRKMKFYEKLKLPDLTSFRAEHVDAPRLSRPRPLDMTSLREMLAARPALKVSDPAVYVANLMFAHWGMRDIEIWNARTHWLDREGAQWRMHIIDRPEEDFWPKGAEGSFEVSEEVVREVLSMQHLCTDGYLVPGATKTDRHNAIYRRHSEWVSAWIKDRRKTSYELRRYAGSRLLDMGASIYQVRDFLRHRNVATTEQWYCYRLQNRGLPTIGLDDLSPKLEVVRTVAA